jgi:AraC-like DNA-binding protein
LLSTSVRHYSDPEQLEAAYSAAKTEIVPTSRRPFDARVVRLDFNRLWLQNVEESAPRIKWTVHSPKRTFIRFLTSPDTTPILDGVELLANQIIHSANGHSYFERSHGPLQWVGMSLPVNEAPSDRILIAGRQIRLPRTSARIMPDALAMSRLRHLQAEVTALTADNPAAFDTPALAHAIEQSLIDAMAECLSDEKANSRTWTHMHHDTVMHRFRIMLEAAPDRALYIPEICDAIRVPERTLRLCCQERLGMSPKHYLLLRRMQMARRALAAADPRALTVTEVATRFGFWHFGRFSVCYRMTFGEPPSVTLRRRPEH